MFVQNFIKLRAAVREVIMVTEGA